MACSSCGQEKELTRHGTCFKCHVSGLQVTKKCKGCGRMEDYLVKKDITSSVTVTQKEG